MELICKFRRAPIFSFANSLSSFFFQPSRTKRNRLAVALVRQNGNESSREGWKSVGFSFWAGLPPKFSQLCREKNTARSRRRKLFVESSCIAENHAESVPWRGYSVENRFRRSNEEEVLNVRILCEPHVRFRANWIQWVKHQITITNLRKKRQTYRKSSSVKGGINRIRPTNPIEIWGKVFSPKSEVTSKRRWKRSAKEATLLLEREENDTFP